LTSYLQKFWASEPAKDDRRAASTSRGRVYNFARACASWYLRGRGRLVSPAACWSVGLADGWPLWRRMARAMLRLRACAAWYLCAGLRVWYLLRLPDWRRWRMAGRPADCRSWPPTCRPSARRADTPPPSEPPTPTACRRSADLPPRPLAAPVCRSAAGQAGAAAEGIYRARYRPRIS